MKGNLIVPTLKRPNPSEVIFLRALTEESVALLIEKRFDVSRDQHDEEVEKMLEQLKLHHLKTREFVCIYAFTTNTWRHLKNKISGMSKGLELAVVLEPTNLIEAGEVWVFNGDIQNLACTRTREGWWHCRFDGDVKKLAEELNSRVPSGTHSSPQQICGQVPEARLYARLTPNLIKHLYYGKPQAKEWADKVSEVVCPLRGS